MNRGETGSLDSVWVRHLLAKLLLGGCDALLNLLVILALKVSEVIFTRVVQLYEPRVLGLGGDPLIEVPASHAVGISVEWSN